MKEPKTYVPKCSAKQVSENILKLSFNAAALRDFLNAHVNERGYLNICVSPRREPGQFGDTHSVWLDTWKPDPAKQSESKRAGTPERPQQPPPAAPTEHDDVPF